MIMTEQDNPNRKTTVNDIDISNDAITTLVEQLENGISMVTLTANNEDGKSYLATLHIGDVVEVKGVADSSPVDPIDWSVVKPCFKGEIQDLVPSITKEHQVCQAVAFGYGYQLKEMRVNLNFGIITPIPTWEGVFDDTLDFIDWSHTNSPNPYIGSYDKLSFFWMNPMVLNSFIGAFSFNLNTLYNGLSFDSCKLHIVAAHYAGIGGECGSFTILPHYSFDGENWTTLNNFPDITSSIQVGVNPPYFPVWNSVTRSTYNPQSQYAEFPTDI